MSKLASVLLVDDDTATNYLNEALLHAMQIADQVLVAQNGAEALEMLAAQQATATPEHPVLVLLDITMPVMDGMTFLEDYQKLPLEQQKNALVIVLTTSMNSDNLARLQSLPFAGMASKPLTVEKVETILQLHLRH